jgi:hypothetical protein
LFIIHVDIASVTRAQYKLPNALDQAVGVPIDELFPQCELLELIITFATSGIRSKYKERDEAIVTCISQ